MADNKNQHFVPRAHFKPFSIGAQGKVINLYNLDRKQAIFNAPLKNQCAGSYFYGRDSKLEKAIQTVEQGYSKCVADLQKPIAHIHDAHELILKRFIYLQYLRTEAAARRSAELVFEMTAVSGDESEKPPFKETVKEAVISAMLTYSDTMHIVDDLKLIIVRNLTKFPFITSDDPAVLANRWHQLDRRRRHMAFGIIHAGVILFLPISPDLLAILYDRDVYTTNHSNGWINTHKPEDINACNYHQALNCTANTYFSASDDNIYVQQAVNDVVHLWPKRRIQIVIAVPALTYPLILNDPESVGESRALA